MFDLFGQIENIMNSNQKIILTNYIYGSEVLLLPLSLTTYYYLEWT